MIKPWVFEFSLVPGVPADPPPDPRTLSDGLRWFFGLWSGLEDIGFEGLFFSEHHFLPKGISPSPNLLVSAMAGRTRKLRLGVMGMVAPMYAPWRLVEEMGMLDVISGGRLEIGLSSGSGPMEVVMAGMPADEIRSRFDETVDILHAALKDGTVTYSGKHFNYQRMRLTPRPVQNPPPIWSTGNSVTGAAAAGQRGHKYCTAFLSVPEVAQTFEAYREASRKAGRLPASDDLGIRRMVFITDDEREGAEVAAATLARLRTNLSAPKKLGQPHSAKSGVPDAPSPAHQAVSDDDAIGGTPKQVAEQIIEQCRRTGAGNFLAYTFANLQRPQIERSYALWRQVIPVLRKAGLD